MVKVSPSAMIEGSIPQEATPPSQPVSADTTLGPAKSVHLVCRRGCVGSHIASKQASTSPLPTQATGGVWAWWPGRVRSRRVLGALAALHSRLPSPGSGLCTARVARGRLSTPSSGTQAGAAGSEISGTAEGTDGGRRRNWARRAGQR